MIRTLVFIDTNKFLAEFTSRGKSLLLRGQTDARSIHVHTYSQYLSTQYLTV